ncbi:hypothetical protein HYALB_00007333 [Hymenoscyphus albidus]|uniref:Histone deacetylase domain-containing protein n=1 Tax=Hymenoscyphus albidus TaxID=595503 RepID=A0A9N9LGI3_9HELO|nr:hypothetical protein HYALB_00007333 [Hymenoscyphus albidus]
MAYQSPPPAIARKESSPSFQASLRRFSGASGPPVLPPASPHHTSPHTSPKPLVSGRQSTQSNHPSPPPNGILPSRSPLPLRSPSSMSVIDAQSSPTPSLLRRSTSSINGITPPRSSPSRAASVVSATPSRRSSSAQVVNNRSTTAGRSPLAEMEREAERPPRVTAISIARNHFEKELELHRREDDTRHANTIAILHDSCYGHRFSRPRTSKGALNTIVERPERIQACILGLSVAYVRLGERHSDGLYPLHPSQDASMVPSGPFRIRKTTRRLSLSSQAVANVHGAKWMEELKIMCDNAEVKLALNGKELLRPDIHRSPGDPAPAKLHEGDLYLCAESLEAMEGALGAVCEGVDSVFEGSASGTGPYRAFVTIRPPGHHCSASYPSGFCWLNNVHVGISHAALTHGLTHAAIIDFDLHHGDGSQAIAWEHNARANGLSKNALPWKKTSIGYFSIHDINSYPCEQGDMEKVKNASLCIENAHGQSIWNVHLQPWKTEAEFWDLYETKYSILLEKTRNYLRNQTEKLRGVYNGPRPKGAIFISAGFDASEWESAGMQRHKVNVPTEFYARLTRDIVRVASEEGTSVDGRVISVLEGGYSDRALYSGVLSHVSGLAGGAPMVIKQETKEERRQSGGLGFELGQKLGGYADENYMTEPVVSEVPEYDPLWWSHTRLDQLDATLRSTPAPPPPEPRKPREGPAPTYSSPTQSFMGKIVSPSARRAVTSMSMSGHATPRTYSRAPTPPPPDVHWTVAAHELSKLLIPSDRQVGSCRPEDLSAEATRVRRDRQSILTPPASVVGAEQPDQQPTTRMALRTRKPAKPIVEEEEEVKKPKTNRRKTVAGAASLAGEKAVARSSTPIPIPQPAYARPTTQASRRHSSVSNGSVISDISSRPSEVSSQRTENPSRPSVQRSISGGAPSYQRPGTSQSVRPESSMSSRGNPIPQVVVRKTRAPAQPRGEPAKSSRVRKKSPLSEGPSGHGQDGANDLPSRPDSAIVPPVPTLPSVPQSDMDSLTSGMQKVKISLITKAQKEAKEKEQQTKRAPKTTKRAPAKTTKTNKTQPETAPILPPTPVEEVNHVKLPECPTSTLTQETEPTLPSTPEPNTTSFQQHFPPHLQKPNDIPLPASSPLGAPLISPSNSTSSSSHTCVEAGNTSSEGVFIPYQPDGPTPQQAPGSEKADVKWLPTNTVNTPSPMKVQPMKRGELPVFTEKSVISFAVNPNLGQKRVEPFVKKAEVVAPQQAVGMSGKIKERESEIMDSQQEDGLLGVTEIPETPQN